MHAQRLRIFSLFLLLVPSVFLYNCARNPVTGKTQLALISEEQEIAYGREAHPEVLAQFGQVEDEALQAYVNGIGQRMAQISHRPELPWHFTVVDVPVVNAFALPGGYIYFTREIMAYMNNEAELAGVMGHEIGHVTARHSVSQISKAQLFSLGLGLGSVFSPTFRQLGEFAQLGVGLLFLKYGRDAERESDDLGVEYMSRVGYDPRELSDFFTVFQRMREESGGGLPDWLSTHPDPGDRIQATRLKAEAVIAQSSRQDWTVGREPFVRQLDGLVFGENPREGFIENGSFLHPEMAFQLRFPQAWRVTNTRSAVAFTEPNGRAEVQLTLTPPNASQSPEGRARELAASPNVQLVQGGNRQVNGNPAFVGHYRVATEGGVLDALASFISYRGHLFQLVGLAPSQVFRNFSGVLESSLNSFAALRDERALAVQPDRIDLYQARSGETLTEIASRINNPRVKAADLELLNRLPASQRLEAGTSVKVVLPGRR